MRFCSTRDSGVSLPLSEALFRPRADDGGLLMPREDPDLRRYLYLMDESTSFPELVRLLGIEILKEDLTPQLLRNLTAAAAELAPTLNRLDSAITLLELYHGPTSSFQDFSMAFLAALMSGLKPAGKRVRILVPTTGDSGAAAAHAFAAEKEFDIVLLCPTEGSGGLPAFRGLPPAYTRAKGGNASVLRVSGPFKGCLELATRAFSDRAFSDRHALAAATTLNPGRLVAQVFHYFFGFINLKKEAGDFYFAVPSGNYGNFSSGLLAWKWGMPVSGFISASPGAVGRKGAKAAGGSPRDGLALGDYLEGGKREKGMPDFSDVSNPENYERIKSMSAGNPAVLRSMIHPSYVTEEQAAEAMREAHAERGVFIDPFTALAYAAARRMQEDFIEENGKILLLATSHPWKYADAVEKACGARPAPPSPREGRDPWPEASRTEPDAQIAPDLGELDAFLAKL